MFYLSYKRNGQNHVVAVDVVAVVAVVDIAVVAVVAVVEAFLLHFCCAFWWQAQL